MVSLDRIEAALARLEAAAHTLASSASAHSDTLNDNNAEAQDLARRHAVFKSSVEKTLARIDGLIAEQS